MMYGWQKAGKRIKSSSKNATQFEADDDGFAVAVALAGDECSSKKRFIDCLFLLPAEFSGFPIVPFPAPPTFPPKETLFGGKRKGASGRAEKCEIRYGKHAFDCESAVF